MTMDEISEMLARSLCDTYRKMIEEIIKTDVSYTENRLTYTLRPRCQKACGDRIIVDFSIFKGKKTLLDMKDVLAMTADKEFKAESHDGLYRACLTGEPPVPVKGKCGGNIAEMLSASFIAMSNLHTEGASRIDDGDRSFVLTSKVCSGKTVITFSVEVSKDREKYEAVRLIGVTHITYSDEVLTVWAGKESYTITDLDGIYTANSIDWKKDAMYDIGSICLYNGILYRSIVKDNYNHEPTDKNWWKQVGGRSTAAATVDQTVTGKKMQVYHGLDTEAILVSIMDIATGTFIYAPHSLSAGGSRNALDFTFPLDMVGKEVRFNFVGIDKSYEPFIKWNEYEDVQWMSLRKITWATMRSGSA